MNINQQRGLSLIELMVAIVISSLLMAGTIQIFVNNKKTYQVQEAVSRLQENGRFGMQFLTRDIRMADFWGCVGSISKVTNQVRVAGTTDTPGPINVTTGGVSGTNDAGLNGSDTLILQGASSGKIRRQAAADGMRSLRQDGWRHLLAGRTTVDEVLRVTKDERVNGAKALGAAGGGA